MTVLVFAIFIAIAALLQQNDNRFFVALAYAFVNTWHYMLSLFIPDHFYHLSAAIACLLAMWWILQMVTITDTSISLLRVCLVEIAVNAIGWSAWFAGYEPTVYNFVYVGIYLWVIVILLRKDKANDSGGYKVDSWRDFLRHVIGSWNPAIQSSNIQAEK